MADFSKPFVCGMLLAISVNLSVIGGYLGRIDEQMKKPVELKQPIVIQSVKLDLSQPEALVGDALLPPPPKVVSPKEKNEKGDKKH